MLSNSTAIPNNGTSYVSSLPMPSATATNVGLPEDPQNEATTQTRAGPLNPLNPLVQPTTTPSNAVFSQPMTDEEVVDTAWALETQRSASQRDQALADLDCVLATLPRLQSIDSTPEHRIALRQQLTKALDGLRPLSDGISKEDLDVWNRFMGSDRLFSDVPRADQHAMSALHGQLAQLWTAAKTGAVPAHGDSVLRQLLLS